jgi:signal transduction histidine kinase
MKENGKQPVILNPQELQAVYTLSQAVAGATNTEATLNRVTKIIRPVFIFDNIVLYEPSENDNLEPTFAKAIGRGRFREADLAWGEITANDAYQAGEITLRVEEQETAKFDRTDIRHFLAMPLMLGEQKKGALVFIRFGGPTFTEDQIHLAEFVALHVAQLLEHRRLVEQIADLEAKRRLDSLQDDFIAMISHELLTPLGFIKGYATTLLRDDTAWEEETRREFLNIIDEESDRLRELIDNMLDSSRLQAGTLHMIFQPTRLDAFLKDLAHRAKALHENLSVDLDISTPNLQVQADPTRLAQVLDNIINNATKYAPGSPLKISLDRSGGSAVIAIQDFGPGIPEEHLDKIFQRFYRVPDCAATARGTGLGLYICRKIVQAHHGKIEANSRVGEGTTFRIHLPLEEE